MAKNKVDLIAKDSAGHEVVIHGLVVPSSHEDFEAYVACWDQYIQQPFIASPQTNSANEKRRKARVDINWQWPIVMQAIAYFNEAKRHTPFGFVIVAETKESELAPVALGMGLKNKRLLFHPTKSHPMNKLTHAYAWYGSVIPEYACQPLGLPVLSAKRTMVAMVETFRYFGTDEGHQDYGRILLHAAPKGGNVLMHIYRDLCGLENITPEPQIIAPAFKPGARTNDGRFLQSKAFNE